MHSNLKMRKDISESDIFFRKPPYGLFLLPILRVPIYIYKFLRK